MRLAGRYIADVVVAAAVAHQGPRDVAGQMQGLKDVLPYLNQRTAFSARCPEEHVKEKRHTIVITWVHATLLHVLEEVFDDVIMRPLHPSGT